VGLIASSLAYGRVRQILKSVWFVLDIMGKSPYLFLKQSSYNDICKSFRGFTHRFSKDSHLADLLWGIKNVIARFGSLNQCFLEGISSEHKDIIPGMTFFTDQLLTEKRNSGHLVALPEKGSACKRMNLFLRWMVRKDKVDPGGWEGIPLSWLIIPLDTHMHKIGIGLKFTERKQASMRTAIEITECFKKIDPGDPVKYDFALTRLGIRDDMNIGDFIGLINS
jgi:uncharacterized protein (TIGR02757 family)